MEKLTSHLSSRVLELLLKELIYARKKHPYFPNSVKEALPVILEELGEVAKSINDQDKLEHILEEVAQTAVTCLRFLSTHADNICVESKGVPFADDADKIRDMFSLSREEFLRSYSYITKSDYEATKELILSKLDIPKEEDHEF